MTRAQSTAFLAPGLGWLALFLLLPCLLLLLNAGIGDDGSLTGERFAGLLDPARRALLLGSLRIAGLATLAALLLGVPAAFAIALAPPRRQPLLLLMVLLPFLGSALFRAFAWSLLLSPEGPLGSLDLVGEWAVILGLAVTYLPFAILAVFVALARQDRRLLEVSADLGASGWRGFRRITLPLTLPGIVAAALFVFLLSLGNFLLPDLVAGRAQPTLGTAVYDAFVTAPDWPSGSALAALLAAAMLLLLLAQALLARRGAPPERRVRRWRRRPLERGDRQQQQRRPEDQADQAEVQAEQRCRHARRFRRASRAWASSRSSMAAASSAASAEPDGQSGAVTKAS